MSKTKGNGLDPLDFIDGISLEELVEKRTTNLTQPQMAPRIEKQTRKDFPEGIPAYGTDALRFTFCALATTGRDVRFDLNRVDGYRNFCNKLWNASKFVMSNTTEFKADDPVVLNSVDHWILTKLKTLLEEVDFALSTYRFDIYAAKLYEFAWHEYCDWYLELTKPLLWDDSLPQANKNGVRQTLLSVLEALLRAAHPVMPFITEALWQNVNSRLTDTPASGSIMIQSYPVASDFNSDADAL